MVRRVIEINEEKCNGCGLCVKACHEGAIALVNGKAKLMRDDYCDGLGDCLPNCPVNAISFIEREAAAYDEAAVKEHLAKRNAKQKEARTPVFHGCPGSMARSMKPAAPSASCGSVPGQLSQWPVQIKLVAPNAPYFHDCDLLIAADCTAYAYGNFHNDFIKNRVTLIGCPKLDDIDYSEKLSVIFSENNIRSITLTRMTVPCCGGLAMAVEKAIAASGKNIPLQIVTISPDGTLV